MATLKELENALIKADEAGDVESARALAYEIRVMLGEQPEPQPQPEAVVSAGRQVLDVPRQLGLTARYGIEGLAGAADVLGAPIRSGLEQVLGRPVQPAGPMIANVLGLPQPQTPTERVVGDVARTLAGTGGVVGAAQLVRPVGQVARGVAEAIAASPLTQAISGGAGAGVAGSVREAGGGPMAQTVSGLLTALGVSPLVQPAATGVSNLVSAARQRLAPTPTPTVNVDIKIENALKPSGIKFGDLSPALQESLRRDISAATQLGPLSPAATQRLVDYRLTGATPTRATLTLDPGEVTRQKNLAKQGANVTDPAAQRLSQIENENNQVLLSRMNTLGAENALEPTRAGMRLIDSISSVANQYQTRISDLYNSARSSGGRAAQLDNYQFTQAAGNALDNANLGAFLPREFKRTLNQISTGKLPLTVDVAEQIKTQLATSQRSATDGNVRAALGAVREALDNAPLQSGQQLGKESIDAFNAARAANREFKNLQENNPFLKDVVEGVEPDKFFEKYVIGQPASNVKKLVNFLPEDDRALLKNQVTAYIKDKATGGQPDDVARLSGLKMNQVIKSIGKDKLEAIFTADEIAQLRAIANVSRYEQFIPVGAAVNTSNTAAAATAMLDRLARSTILGRIPLGTEIVGRPLQNIIIGSQAQRATQVPQALTIEQLRRTGTISPPLGLLFQERE
jgi:hypothetical protein